KLLIGLKDGTVSTEEAFTKAGTAADVYRKEVKDLRDEAEKLKPKTVDITVRTRWDDSSGGYDRWESAHDRTVTTTFVTNGSPGGGGD
ncbi:hypothetical protein U2088_15565, partial [Listeria monocytogenes]|uniref:hypothetical protein n=1 Tax=Listeria monocytogenes TaxID=1639 RepID=UPI002FDBDFB9